MCELVCCIMKSRLKGLCCINDILLDYFKWEKNRLTAANITTSNYLLAWMHEVDLFFFVVTVCLVDIAKHI